jgi:hypothetical protein
VSEDITLTSGPPGLAATAMIGESLNLVVSRVFNIRFFIFSIDVSRFVSGIKSTWKMRK